MSHTRAYAYASSLSVEDLRPALVATLEALYHCSDALEVAPPTGKEIRSIEWVEGDLLEAIDGLRDEVKRAESEAERASQESEAVDGGMLEALRERVATLEGERDAALRQVAGARHMVEAHADLVSTARRFVSASVDAGVPLKHARAVKAGKAASHG